MFDLILLLIIIYWSSDVNFRNAYFTLKFFSCEAAIFNGIFGLKLTDQENCSHCYCCCQTFLLYLLFLEKRTCFILMLTNNIPSLQLNIYLWWTFYPSPLTKLEIQKYLIVFVSCFLWMQLSVKIVTEVTKCSNWYSLSFYLILKWE